MKLILAASAIVLAAGAADAAVIRYGVDAIVTLDSAERYFDGQLGVDVSDEYEPTQSVGAELFEIDTSVFTGNSFEFSGPGYPAPDGVTAAQINFPIYEFRAQFDADWNLTYLYAYFDGGGGSETLSFSLDGAGLYPDTSIPGYEYNPQTGQFEFAIDYYGYSSNSVDITKTYVDGPAPVPLPASALLLLTGLASAGALRFRRK